MIFASNNTKEQIQIVDESEFVRVEESDSIHVEELEQKAYRAGYQKGWRAMHVQMGKNSPDSDADANANADVIAAYTVHFEIQDKDKERLEQAMSKGYVDGYHKASEMFSQPKSCTY